MLINIAYLNGYKQALRDLELYEKTENIVRD
jgi:hypothetical protein